ncbi:hypothetical protein UFOVP142_61 [uncultured Caudovirales phage]|uniref:Uncharacterized protein n=1 Tax=uncultured Caudovirales phage TaxID=2100421 RepID=A0A6J7XL56_9CAUD|nr:hypothetical protein UFOVP142_61 [uncultured Caudovirales phage]
MTRPPFDERDARYYAHAIRQFDHKAEAVSKGQRWSVEATADDGNRFTLDNFSEYIKFRCKYIRSEALKAHRREIEAILDSDPGECGIFEL